MSTGKRQHKSPAQRAEEQLGVAERLVERLESQRRKHKAAIGALVPLIEEAKRRREYLAQHPDLPGNSEPGAPAVAGGQS